MKQIISFKFITAALTLIVLLVVFQGCKKIDNNLQDKDTAQATYDRIKASVQEQIAKRGGVAQVFPVHKKMITAWGDKNGNLIDPKLNPGSFGGCTNYDLPDYTDLIQYQRIYNCDEPGYFMQFEFNVSWSHVIVNNNGSALTSGSIRIYADYAPYSQVFSADLSGSDATITDLGVDPNNSLNHIYNVKFDYSFASYGGGSPSLAIPRAYLDGDLSGTYTVRLGASFASSCPDFYSIFTVPASAYGFTGNTAVSPCDRNDQPGFVYPSAFGLGVHKIGVSNQDPMNICGAFTEPDLQEVQYSLNGGVTWNLFPNFISGYPTSNPILQYGFIRYNDFAESVSIASGHYDVIIRFRNWKYSSIPSPLTIPDPLNGDCQSPDNTNDPASPNGYSSWAYMYYFNLAI
jgi:hypothetical protein